MSYRKQEGLHLLLSPCLEEASPLAKLQPPKGEAGCCAFHLMLASQETHRHDDQWPAIPATHHIPGCCKITWL